jgi:hypothetical protein
LYIFPRFGLLQQEKSEPLFGFQDFFGYCTKVDHLKPLRDPPMLF